MNILFVGDIVGSSGRKIVKNKTKELIKEYNIDLAFANAENVAGGLGITGSLVDFLFDCGFNAITLGNHTWSKREMIDSIKSEKYVIRPANVSKKWPGEGYCIFYEDFGNVVLINLIGRVGIGILSDCPFEKCEEMIDTLKEQYNPKITIIDFHAEATAEKQAFARYFDGKVSLIVGTHTHVQTADETILDNGTGYITDLGMTGPANSVIGMDLESSIRRFTTKMPVPYKVANGPAMLSGIVAKIDEETGFTTHISRININSETQI